MVQVTKSLVEETGALVGYTQSDEISLVLHSDSIKSQLWFDGKLQKIVSVSASFASAAFNAAVPTYLPERDGHLAVFDSRAWNVPSLVEAANVLVWRELDATKNSVSMAARHYYSHKALMNKGRAEMMDMLMEKGVNWNDYPAFFKRGTYVRRVHTSRTYTAAEIEKLPLKHAARSNPDLVVERTDIRVMDLPPITKVEDKVGLLFG
jgi:tRNA(His) 5'-end guanylyltransferase